MAKIIYLQPVADKYKDLTLYKFIDFFRWAFIFLYQFKKSLHKTQIKKKHLGQWKTKYEYISFKCGSIET